MRGFRQFQSDGSFGKLGELEGFPNTCRASGSVYDILIKVDVIMAVIIEGTDGYFEGFGFVGRGVEVNRPPLEQSAEFSAGKLVGLHLLHFCIFIND
jgi:hypothetical protein